MARTPEQSDYTVHAFSIAPILMTEVMAVRVLFVFFRHFTLTPVDPRLNQGLMLPAVRSGSCGFLPR